MFESLIKLIRKEEVSLFIGAGFSIEASAPSVSQLKELILNDFDDEDLKKQHTDDDLAELSSFYVNELCVGSRNQLISLLKKAFEFTPSCMDDHKKLAHIPHISKIFTTNYDTLLEDSYQPKDINVVRTDKDCTYLENPISIFKVHGDFTDPNSVIITSDDYEKFNGSWPNQAMWNLVKTEFLTKHILFIGYSLEDDNILQVIQSISESVNDNQKSMFLIAPGINIQKQQRLKKMHVKYYDAYAKDFLAELTKELENNISSDFRKKYISADTYARFCSYYNYVPSVNVELGENHIVDYKSLDGEPLRHKLTMTVNNALGKILLENDFDKNGKIIEKDPLYSHVPCLHLSDEDLIRCLHSVNGVVVEEKIKEIIIGPQEKKMQLTIRIPDENFFELVEAKRYALNSHKVLFLIGCHIFNLTIIVDIQDQTRNISFRFDFNAKYQSCDEALKWIKVPIAFFSNKEVYISELSENAFKFNDGRQIEDHNFYQYQQYYQDIKDIELLTRRKFSVYYECIKERYQMARAVVHYLRHESFAVPCDSQKGLDYTVTDVEPGLLKSALPVNEQVSLVSTETNAKKITLNDRLFEIPYTHQIFNSCLVRNISPKDIGQAMVNFQYDSQCYYVLYSNKPANEEFPDLRPINELIKNISRI